MLSFNSCHRLVTLTVLVQPQENSKQQCARSWMETPPLPIEILVRIFQLIDINDLLRAGEVCRDWSISSEDNSLWLDYYSRRTGQDLCHEPFAILVNSLKNVSYKRKYIESIRYLLGKDDFQLAISSTPIYASQRGQTLQGIVILKPKRDLVANGVFLRIFCEEKAFVVKSPNYKVGQFRFEPIGSILFDQTFAVKSHPDRSSVKFLKGSVYCLRFAVPFPHKGKNGEYLSGTMQPPDTPFMKDMTGSIVYGVEAFLGDQYGIKKLKTATKSLKVWPKYDIKEELARARPLTGSIQSYKHSMSVMCSTDTFLLGHTVPLHINVTNATSKPVKKIQISIRSISFCPLGYFATLSHEMFQQKLPSKRVISWELECPVPAQQTKDQKIDLRIPVDLEQSILYSGISRRRHYLWVKLSLAVLLKLPIVITEYHLSQKEKDDVDKILQTISSSEADTVKLNVLKTSASDLFQRWRDSKNNGIETYFIEKGGPSIFIEAIKSTTDNTIRTQLISACRNFGESSALNMEIIQAGALPVIISLANSGDLYTSNEAFAWLWDLLEMEELLDVIAEQGVPDLLKQTALEIEGVSSLLVAFRYRHELFGCLQCAAINEKFRAALFPVLNHFLALLDDYKKYETQISQQQKLGYTHVGAFIANMAVGEKVRNSTLKHRVFKVLKLIRMFNTPQTVADAEFNLGYVWKRPKMYLHIIETDMIDIQRFGAPPPMSWLIFADQNTRQRMIEQQVVEKIHMLTYSYDSDTQRYATEALLQFNSTLDSVASLKTLCYWHLMMSRGINECRKILNENNINY